MTTQIHTRTRITPWDDREFVRTYEATREAVHQEATPEDLADLPIIAAQIQRRLHEVGYPQARVEVTQTAEEAIDRVSHWVVSRDG